MCNGYALLLTEDTQMAKFRSGNLILSSVEKIIQGGTVVVDDSRAVSFATLQGDTGAQIVKFDTNVNLGTVDTAVPTQKAVKDYVDSKISGSIAASTDNALARYDGTDGIQGSGITVDDLDGLSGISNMNVGSGNTNVHISGADGAIELTNSGDNPHVDFKTDSTADYDARVELDTNGLRFRTGGEGSIATALILNSVKDTIVAQQLQIQGTTKKTGYLYAGASDPTNTLRLNYDGYLYATKVYNAVWG